MSVRKPSVELGFFVSNSKQRPIAINDTIWLDLAYCIGHALAKRWLARRRGPRTLAATDPIDRANPVPEGQVLKDKAAGTGRPHTDSSPSE
jgi:hypothetical protein